MKSGSRPFEPAFHQAIQRLLWIRFIGRCLRAVVIGYVLFFLSALTYVGWYIDREFASAIHVTGKLQPIRDDISEGELVTLRYDYTYQGRRYTGKSKLSRECAASLHVGDAVEVIFPYWSPLSSRLAIEPTELQKLFELLRPIAIFVFGAFGTYRFFEWWSGDRMRERSKLRALARVNAGSPLPDDLLGQLDLLCEEDASLLPMASMLQRWQNPFSDRGANAILDRWLRNQPSPVDFGGYLQRLEFVYRAVRPAKETPEHPVATLGERIVFFANDSSFQDDTTSPGPVYTRWRRMLPSRAGVPAGSDRMVLVLEGLEVSAALRPWETMWRELLPVARRISRRFYQSRRGKARAIEKAIVHSDILADWKREVPLRHFLGEDLVSEEFLTAPEALAMIDGALLRFGGIPWDQRPQCLRGFAEYGSAGQRRSQLELVYTPDVSLIVRVLGEAPQDRHTGSPQ